MEVIAHDHCAHRPAGGAQIRWLAASFSVGAAGSPADFAGGAAVCLSGWQTIADRLVRPAAFYAKDTAAQHPAAPQPAPAAQPSAEPALSKTQPASAAAPAGAAAPAAQSPQASVAAKAAPTPAPATEFTGEHPKSSALPFHISERIETALNLLAHDPAAFVRCMFEHLRWIGRFLARHIKVQHLTVFWTVTGEDAAQTAGLYGAAMTAANNLLAFLQQVVCLQCDHLQLESDFTGQRRGERYISGRLHTHTFLLLWLLIRLLFRLGKDPQLQPAHIN